MTHSGFQKRCAAAAKHFLQSVVVIDNQAELYEGEWEHSAGSNKKTVPSDKTLGRKPSSGLSKERTNRTTKPKEKTKPEDTYESRSARTGADKSHKLQAWILTEGLADSDILCTVYRPDYYNSSQASEDGADRPECHSVVIRSTKMARLADVVVLDWELGGDQAGDKGTWKAREIIKAIIKRDNLNGGRQRLLTVYTATPDLNSVYADVVNDLGSINYSSGKFEQNKKELTLTNKTTRIVFLNKKTDITESKNTTTVPEQDLPGRLIEEFIKLNRGLFPTIVLHSIASVREATHHILSTFNSKLDPALISHRSLLPDPQDSEEFVLDLVSGEFRSALSLNQIGKLHADVKAHKDWITEYLSKQETFITLAEAIELVTTGSDTLKKVCAAVSHRIKDSNKQIEVPSLSYNNLIELFTENQKDGMSINYEFSRLTTLKREQFGNRHLPEGWPPKLTQGSIIREISADGKLSNEFLLCIQPRCDSVRLKQERAFPFLVLTNNKPKTNAKKFLVVKCRKELGLDSEDITLWISPFPYCQKMLVFAPATPDSDIIDALLEEDIWVFKREKTRYEWIADMKDFQTQNICNMLSGRLGTAGLDEYEWLRRKSNS